MLVVGTVSNTSEIVLLAAMEVDIHLKEDRS